MLSELNAIMLMAQLFVFQEWFAVMKILETTLWDVDLTLVAQQDPYIAYIKYFQLSLYNINCTVDSSLVRYIKLYQLEFLIHEIIHIL